MSAPQSSKDALAAPLLMDDEEEEEIIPTAGGGGGAPKIPRESMEETTQHFIEDLQLEREQSLIIGGTTDGANDAEEETDEAGKLASAGTTGEDDDDVRLPTPPLPPFRSAETFLSTASSPRGRAQAFLRNKLGPLAGGSPKSASSPGVVVEHALHTTKESSVPLRPLLD